MWPEVGPFMTARLLYVAGLGLHFLLSWGVAREERLEHRVWIAASCCYFFAMVIGSRILFDLLQGKPVLANFWRVSYYFQSGLWGGLLGYFVLAVTSVLLLTKKRKAAMDLVALAVPLPWMLAKLHCLCHGCCYGRPTSVPWAIIFPSESRAAPPGIPIHPSQIYEMLIMLGILMVFRLLPRERWRGTLVLWFVVVYGAGRAFTDVFRGDAQRHHNVGPFTETQLICLLAVLAALAVLVWRGWQTQRAGRPGSERQPRPPS